jgi:hypothetical protein
MRYDQFVNPEEYAAQAAEMSGGATPTSGMPAYPLYGLPASLGQTVVDTPIYRRPLVCFSAGAVVVGLAWAYFGWWRPRQQKVKKNSED